MSRHQLSGIRVSIALAVVLALGVISRGDAASRQAGSGAARASASKLTAGLRGDAQRIAAALEAHNRYEQSTAGRSTADDAATAARHAAKWAMWLFIVGAVETVVTAAGVYLVYRTLGEAQRSANEAKRGADEMRRSADAATEAYNLANKEFAATHRPKLVVRGVRPKLEGDGTRSDPIGSRLMVSFELANIGDTQATLVATAMSIIFLNGGRLPTERVPEKGHFEMPGHDKVTLAPGEATEMWAGSPEATYRAEMFGNFPPGHGLFFVGHILYAPDGGPVRRVSFCRRQSNPKSDLGYWPASNYYDFEATD